MVINIGPQHPSTHGVLRLEDVTDGEIVVGVTPHLGYLHRCFEKHGESVPFNQVIPFVDRLDYVAAMNNEHAYAMGVERITVDPHVMQGKACVRGMRITVSLVVNLVANGMSNAAIIEEYPDLVEEDIRECLRYAACLAEERVLPIETHNTGDHTTTSR